MPSTSSALHIQLQEHKKQSDTDTDLKPHPHSLSHNHTHYNHSPSGDNHSPQHQSTKSGSLFIRRASNHAIYNHASSIINADSNNPSASKATLTSSLSDTRMSSSSTSSSTTPSACSSPGLEDMELDTDTSSHPSVPEDNPNSDKSSGIVGLSSSASPRNGGSASKPLHIAVNKARRYSEMESSEIEEKNYMNDVVEHEAYRLQLLAEYYSLQSQVHSAAADLMRCTQSNRKSKDIDLRRATLESSITSNRLKQEALMREYNNTAGRFASYSSLLQNKRTKSLTNLESESADGESDTHFSMNRHGSMSSSLPNIPSLPFPFPLASAAAPDAVVRSFKSTTQQPQNLQVRKEIQYECGSACETKESSLDVTNEDMVKNRLSSQKIGAIVRTEALNLTTSVTHLVKHETADDAAEAALSLSQLSAKPVLTSNDTAIGKHSRSESASSTLPPLASASNSLNTNHSTVLPASNTNVQLITPRVWSVQLSSPSSQSALSTTSNAKNIVQSSQRNNTVSNTTLLEGKTSNSTGNDTLPDVPLTLQHPEGIEALAANMSFNNLPSAASVHSHRQPPPQPIPPKTQQILQHENEMPHSYPAYTPMDNFARTISTGVHFDQLTPSFHSSPHYSYSRAQHTYCSPTHHPHQRQHQHLQPQVATSPILAKEVKHHDVSNTTGNSKSNATASSNTNTQGAGEKSVYVGSSCHQCKTRRDVSSMISCTSDRQKHSKRPCKKKFCLGCLSKNYDTPNADQLPQWICPSCLNVCLCASCRRGREKEGETAISTPTPTAADLQNGQSDAIADDNANAVNTHSSNPDDNLRSSLSSLNHSTGCMTDQSSTLMDHSRTTTVSA